jgi:hypothetical protein
MKPAIENLKNEILANNELFNEKGFIINNQAEFVSIGISTNYINQFYIRHAREGATKYKVSKQREQVQEVSGAYRLVAQISVKYNAETALDALLAKIASMPAFEVDAYSDDTEGIYRSEYGDGAVIRDFSLISIDFRYIEEVVLKSLDCTCNCFELCN